ncbi:MAG: hypothetical protein ACRCWR_05495, partial [Saezia sp.]
MLTTLFQHLSLKRILLACFAFVLLLSAAGYWLYSSTFAQARQPTTGSYYAMQQQLTHKEISQLLGTPYPLPKFNPKRTAEELTANCKHWPIPESTDADANNWYRAATSIHAINLRTVEQHQ